MMSDHKKFRPGQRVRVSYETTVVESSLHELRVAHPSVGATLPARVPLSAVEPVDDPATDPVGTVRRMNSSEHPLVMVRMAAPHHHWDDLFWCEVEGRTSNSWNGDDTMRHSTIIGAVPGTAAWEVYGSGE